MKANNIANMRLTIKKRTKQFAAERLKKKAAELQQQLNGIIAEINRTEDEIAAAKRNDERAWLEVTKVKAGQQQLIEELSLTMVELDEKIPHLRKEKQDAEEASHMEKEELRLCEEKLREKEEKLEKIKEIAALKKQDLNDLHAEQKQIEKEFQEEMQRLEQEDCERRKAMLQSYLEEYRARIDGYARQSKEIEESLASVNEERQLLHQVITKYSERLPLLEEKQMLLTTEFQCLANAEVIIDHSTVDNPSENDTVS